MEGGESMFNVILITVLVGVPLLALSGYLVVLAIRALRKYLSQ